MGRAIGQLAGLVAAAALAGCATLPTEGPPTVSYVAPAPLAAVRDCILTRSDQVSDYFHVPVKPPQVTDTQALTRINFAGTAWVFVELRPTAGGTDVRYVRRLSKIKPFGEYDAVVRGCERPG